MLGSAPAEQSPRVSGSSLVRLISFLLRPARAAPPQPLAAAACFSLYFFFRFFFPFLADLLNWKSCFQTAGKKTSCLASILVLQRSTAAEGEQPKSG